MTDTEAPTRQRNDMWRIAGAAAALGAGTIVTQTLMLRQFLSVFAGNELVIGTVLAVWLILTGGGALIGRGGSSLTRTPAAVPWLLLLLALLPIGMAFALAWLRNALIPPGTTVSFDESIYGACAVLTPYCVPAGYLFTRCAQMLSAWSGDGGVARTYAFEAGGSVLGGLALNLFLIPSLPTLQILLLVAIVMTLTAGALVLHEGSLPARIGVPVSLCILVILASGADLDAALRRLLFAGQEVSAYQDTPYGSLTVTRVGEQMTFYADGLPLFSTQDVIRNEESVHFAMLQRPDPRAVLLLSGGIAGTTEEILKYGVERVDYVEINPWLIELGRRFDLLPNDPRVSILPMDARLFVRSTDSLYDVVLVNVPDPLTAQLNRYYTIEFFRDLKRLLREGGVVSLGLLSSVEYYGEEARRLNSVLVTTLKEVFSTVAIIPGSRNYFLASDGPLDIRVAHRSAVRNLGNLYVNPYYLSDETIAERSASLGRGLSANAGINRDFLPVAYYRHIRYWLLQGPVSLWIAVAAVVLLGVMLIKNLNTVSVGMFSGGFSASAVEFLLLVAFQAVYGSVYQMIGMIITVFMLGLGAGAVVGARWRRFPPFSSYVRTQFLVGLFCLLLPAALEGVHAAVLPGGTIIGVFLLLTSGMAFLVGVEFALATRLRAMSAAAVAGELYGVDLIGAALGALLTSTVLLPLAGVLGSCLVVGVMSIGSGIVAYAARGRFRSGAQQNSVEGGTRRCATMPLP